MFAKSKSSGSTPSILLPNALQNLYEVGKQSATAGPENAWRIYDGYTKTDRKVISNHKTAFQPLFRLLSPHFLSVSLSSSFSLFHSSRLKFFLSRLPGSLDIFFRQEIGRQAAQAKTQGDRYGNFTDRGATNGTILSSEDTASKISPRPLASPFLLTPFFVDVTTKNHRHFHVSRHTRSKSARIVWHSRRSRFWPVLQTFWRIRNNARTTLANRRATQRNKPPRSLAIVLRTQRSTNCSTSRSNMDCCR